MQYDKSVSSKPDSFFIEACTLCSGWVNLHTIPPAAVTWRGLSFEETRWENNYCMYTPYQELNYVTKRVLYTRIHGFQMRSWHPTTTSETIQCTWKTIICRSKQQQRHYTWTAINVHGIILATVPPHPLGLFKLAHRKLQLIYEACRESVGREGNFLCLLWQHCSRPWSFICELCSFDSGRTGYEWEVFAMAAPIQIPAIYTVCGKMLYLVLNRTVHIPANIMHSTQSVPTDSRANVHQLVSECRFLTFCVVTDLNIYRSTNTHCNFCNANIFGSV
jgi:hypothetical protein